MCYHVLLELLAGCLWEAPRWLGSRQLAVCPPQPQQEVLQLAMETLGLEVVQGVEGCLFFS